MAAETKKQKEIIETEKQVGKFSIVGAANTVLDISLFNFGIKFFSWLPWQANVFSTSIAMASSFYFNKKWTFKDKSSADALKLLKFIVFTLFSAYVINTGMVYILTSVFTTPGIWAYSIIQALGFGGIFSQTFVINNFAKCWGIAFAMVWNFITYKKWVFTK